MNIFQLKNPSASDVVVNRLKYMDRFSRTLIRPATLSSDEEQWCSDLKKNGHCMISNLISKEELSALQSDIDIRIRLHEYEIPCLSQVKIDPSNPNHSKIIDKYFAVKNDVLESAGLTFDTPDVQSLTYEEMLERFKPSTLKLGIPSSDKRYFDVWLHPTILRIVEEYMGMRPYCVEAYIRRNFPAQFPVMNHNWHRDTNHRFYVLKLFVFFSDCTIETGPHQYVEGSHREFDINGKKYYSEAEVDAYVATRHRSVITSEVKAGTVIIEDTRGLHRAVIPRIGIRDMGYSVFVPLTIPSSRKFSDYKCSVDVYRTLSRFQQSFIPSKSFN